MTDQLYQGGYYAVVNGLLAGSPDVRLKLVTADFSYDPDDIYLQDGTLGEFDGIGYQEIDCQNVSFAYDAAEDEYQLTFDADEFNASGGTVTPGSQDATGIAIYLYVDGGAGDILIGYTDSGGFPFNAANTEILYTPHADGMLVLRQAA